MPAVEAEKLLRIALFSDTLRLHDSPLVLSHNGLPNDHNVHKSELVERRRMLAQLLRESRRKGVVPVFFSFMWFLFALAISIVSISSSTTRAQSYSALSGSRNL